MVRVENLKAINNGKAVQVEYLGHLLWYTVSDELGIPAGDLKAALTELGLERFMPRPVEPKDAFRRVTKSLEVKRHPYGRKTFVNLLVREIKYQSDGVIRQLVREVVDQNNVRLDYKPVVQMEIDRNDVIKITPLTDDLTELEKAAAGKVMELYDQARRQYDGTHVRYMLSVMLNKCDPVSVRPNGGVVFVPQKYEDMVNALKQLSRRLSQYRGHVKVWSVPVIDATEHREMVQESLEEQVTGETLALIQEMKDILTDANRKVTPKLAQSYADRIRRLKEMVAEYESMLELQAAKARESLELAREQAVKLLDRVEVD